MNRRLIEACRKNPKLRRALISKLNKKSNLEKGTIVETREGDFAKVIGVTPKRDRLMVTLKDADGNSWVALGHSLRKVSAFEIKNQIAQAKRALDFWRSAK